MAVQARNSCWSVQRRNSFTVSAVCLLLAVADTHAQPSLFDSSFQIGHGTDGAVNAILVQRDGKILVGGEFTMIAGQTNDYLARLNSDGRLDTTFGSGTDGAVNRLLELPNGRILVAGEFTKLLGIARRSIGVLLTNGLVDTSLDPGTNFEGNEIVRTICVQSNGSIVTASESLSLTFPFSRLSRFYPDGTLDESFTRTYITDFHIYALYPLTNGTILVGGGFQSIGPAAYSGLALLNEYGQVETNMPHLLTNNSTVFSLTESTNGNILVGGLLHPVESTNQEVLAQLKPSWKWDESFDTDEFSNSANGVGAYSRAVILQPDGKFVVAGDFYEVGGYWRRHIARLDAQGHVDPCFDPRLGLGDAVNSIGARALARQSDGRVLVGGSFDNTAWTGAANIARLLPDSDCGTMRAYVVRMNEDIVAVGTCPPGGTNLLQMSTNLIEWETIDLQLSPYVFGLVDTTRPAAFYRVKKVF